MEPLRVSQQRGPPNRPLDHAMLNTAQGDDIVIHTILILKEALEQRAD
jgi:hypothetical protein